MGSKSVDRAKENSLRTSLAVVRDAIDQFAADKGRYPASLIELAEVRYLRELPEDPLTGRRDTWVELQPPPDSSVERGLYDVRSGAEGKASDGTLYLDW